MLFQAVEGERVEGLRRQAVLLPQRGKRRARSGKSSIRSRKGGRRSGTTFRRKNRSSRNRPCWISLRRSRLLAATIRTSVLIGVRRLTVGFTLLQHPQQSRLRVQRHVADLVEEQRAAFGLLEPAGRRVGAGERAALVAEQLGLDQVARDRRQVDGDERAVAPTAKSCSARATSSLPVPDSPVISTVRSASLSRASIR